jgi:two-component system, cell cycle response regulator
MSPGGERVAGVTAPGMADHELRFVGSGLRVPERLIRMSIAAMIPVFGLIAVVMLFSDEGPSGTVSRVVVIAVAASTVPAAVVMARANLTPIWWARTPRTLGVDQLFVAYGDIGVSIVLFTFSQPETALFGSLLFAIMSAWVAHFCSPTVRTFHIVLTTTVILVLTVLTWRTGSYTASSVIARCLVAIAVVNGTVLLQGMFAFGVREAIRTTLVRAHQDPLTSLWNRRGFTYWATATVQAGQGPVGVLVVDIDDYKSINDTHGHRIGDDVLELAARRLETAIGDRGVLARIGGDEFAIAAELPVPQLIALAEAARNGVHRAEDAVPVTASIGVALTSRPGCVDRVMSTMLDAADVALYEAKAAGRNRVAYVDMDDALPHPRIVDEPSTQS